MGFLNNTKFNRVCDYIDSFPIAQIIRLCRKICNKLNINAYVIMRVLCSIILTFAKMGFLISVYYFIKLVVKSS